METYVRLVQETIEARAKEEQSAFDDLGGEEKTLVCMNLLKTIDQLVSSLEKAPVSLAEVELIVAPALELTIRANLVGESFVPRVRAGLTLCRAVRRGL